MSYLPHGFRNQWRALDLNTTFGIHKIKHVIENLPDIYQVIDGPIRQPILHHLFKHYSNPQSTCECNLWIPILEILNDLGYDFPAQDNLGRDIYAIIASTPTTIGHVINLHNPLTCLYSALQKYLLPGPEFWQIRTKTLVQLQDARNDIYMKIRFNARELNPDILYTYLSNWWNKYPYYQSYCVMWS